MTIAGFTSTGSKRPDVLFGSSEDVPMQMVRAEGCRLWDARGNEYLEAARRGLLFKRTAYNFVSLAHTEPVVQSVMERLEAAMDSVSSRC